MDYSAGLRFRSMRCLAVIQRFGRTPAWAAVRTPPGRRDTTSPRRLLDYWGWRRGSREPADFRMLASAKSFTAAPGLPQPRDAHAAVGPTAAADRRRSGQVSRLVKRLHVRGLVAKIPRSCRWRITQLGHAVLSAAIQLREEAFPARPPRDAAKISHVAENSDRKSPSASEVAFDPQRDDSGCEAIVLRHEQAEFDHPAVVEMCRQRSPGGVVEVLGLDEGIDSRQ